MDNPTLPPETEELTDDAVAHIEVAPLDGVPTEAPAEEKPRLNWIGILREIVETLLLTALIFFAVNAVTARFKIDGASMSNTFADGQYIIVSRINYLVSAPQRGDVVVFVPPGSPENTLWERLLGLPGETDYIKRVVGMPGDRIEIREGQIFINDVLLNEPYIREQMLFTAPQVWELGPDQYFVMGDNRNASQDSRTPRIGPISGDRIVGKVLMVYFPFGDLSWINHYRHPELQVSP